MRIFLGFIIAIAFVLPAMAQKTPPPPRSMPSDKSLANIVFKEVEKRAIEKFFGKKAAAEKDDEGDDKKKHKKKSKKKGKGRGKGLPPGLAKRDKLPPGLQKQLERNGTLPPGLAKRNLPPELEKNLPSIPDTLERVIAGGSVVLLEKATGKILDVIQGVLSK